MVSIVPVQAFKDNYVWMIVSGKRVIVIDPGEALPVIEYLAQHQLTLQAVLITHHHHDHTDGLAQLLEKWPVAVYGSHQSSVATVNNRVNNNDCIHVSEMALDINIIETPGHTRDHIAYYIPICHALFSGDCLFNGGCGRIFEGTAQQMLNTLDTLAVLPPETLVYSAHEYTLSNMRFAALIEPSSSDVQQRLSAVERLRAAGQPTIPATLAEEKQTNPFLRVRESAVIQAVSQYAGFMVTDPVTVFSTLREWKNLV